MHGREENELHREMGTNRHVREETEMARHQCVLKIHGGESKNVCLVQEHPKISSKAISTGMIVASALWRRSFWKHYQAHRRLISVYEVRKDA